MPTSTFAWADIDALREQYAVTTPEGAFTTDDYAERYSLSDSTARRQLKRLVDAGKLRSGTITRDGHLVRVYWP